MINSNIRERVMIADELIRDPATFLKAEIKNYIANSPNNIMPDFPGAYVG